MKKLIQLAVCLTTTLAAVNCGAVQVILSGPLQNVTKTLPIILEPISYAAEGVFWTALLAKGAITALEKGLVNITNFDVGVWTYNLLEHNKFVWADRSYPTRDLTVITSYYYDPRMRRGSWVRRLQFTTINQYTGAEDTTVNWDVTPPLVYDFNYLVVNYKRIAVPLSHDTTFDYNSTAKTMFFCYRGSGTGYPRPLRVRVYGLNWVPKFQNDSMRKTFLGSYEDSRWIIMGIDGMVTWSPAIPVSGNVEFHDVGETTAFYQFPVP